TDSDTRQLLALKKKVAELEQIVGQKQILIDFKDKMIDLAEETYGVDNELPRRKQTEYQPQKAKTKYAASGWGINPKEIKVKAQYLFTFLHFHIDKFGFPIVFQMNI
ncbi:MAG: hypothetical protein JJE17_01920, partial [Peptostreptococcaceae bacterium]|nr:hypothetical protein [Peptostreptococcaceae bacterium]